MNVRDSTGEQYQLAIELKRGGEGAIWSVMNRPDLVAKIYHRPGDRPESKLAWMIDHPPDDPTASALDHISIAWPRTILYRGGEFAGCLLPFIGDAVPLLQVFNPRLRQRTLPAFDWSYLHRTSANLASVVEAIHAKGYVIGDLNEGNFLVRPDTLVTMLDCDSFQVIAFTGEERRVFRCPVGKAEYTPPELQGVSYAKVDRTTDHDSFGIGVLIFQLLLNGNHPFRSDWRGHGDAPELSVKIRQGLFPYGQAAPKQVAPPDGAPTLDWLHPALQRQMIRCFVDGHHPSHRRPTAEEWSDVVKEAERALIKCTRQHVYSGHLSVCPWCDSTRKRLPTVRKSKHSAAPGHGTRGVQTPPASPITIPQPSRSPSSPLLWMVFEDLLTYVGIPVSTWLRRHRRRSGQRRRVPGHVVIAIIAGLILLYSAISSYSR